MRPIGIFDSGVGGLTVLKALRERLPDENFVYLGDTARLPYGTKSAASILRYARQATRHLQQRDIKLLVIACNTASAVALESLQADLQPLPVIGVVHPGASAAVHACPAGRHLVLATEATVGLHAYGNAIRALDKEASVQELACELLVALAEEGWTSGGIADAVVGQYLQPFLSDLQHSRPESIILGCTHFPILRETIRRVVGDELSIVDSAGTTAQAVAELLESAGLARNADGGGRLELLATDGARRFARVGGAFLGAELKPDDVLLVDL
ncbi:MAG: glutamate racemase [Woeseia sp.]